MRNGFTPQTQIQVDERTFFDYLAEAAEYKKNNTWQRAGQAYMNTLADFRPHLYISISKSHLDNYHRVPNPLKDLDPFHHDEKLGTFLMYIQEKWND